MAELVSAHRLHVYKSVLDRCPYPVSNVANPVIGRLAQVPSVVFANVVVFGLGFSRLVPANKMTF